MVTPRSLSKLSDEVMLQVKSISQSKSRSIVCWRQTKTGFRYQDYHTKWQSLQDSTKASFIENLEEFDQCLEESLSDKR